MNHKALTLFCALTVFCLSACTKHQVPAAPPFLRQHVGEVCTVQFRRDALGAGTNPAIAPTTINANGVDVALLGKLVAVEGEGLVIEVAQPRKATYWVPYPVILSVEPAGHP